MTQRQNFRFLTASRKGSREAGGRKYLRTASDIKSLIFKPLPHSSETFNARFRGKEAHPMKAESYKSGAKFAIFSETAQRKSIIYCGIRAPN